jgi:hypothetical protein
MTPEEVYECWAPAGGRWSPWAKPVVFAHLHVLHESLDQPWAGESPGLPGAVPVIDAAGETAVVVDVPGADGVELGLALASRGFRPVPLYNAVPLPVLATGGRGAGQVAVDLGGVANALESGAAVLAATTLPWDAPPAFLLDARRRAGDVPGRLAPGMFDNRSVSLPSDFPSANALLAVGIRRVVVVVPMTQASPQNDLAHTLRRWQDAGIAVELLQLGADLASRPIDVQKPKWYRAAWHALLVRMGLRPHLLGGFGGFIPIPSAG